MKLRSLIAVGSLGAWLLVMLTSGCSSDDSSAGTTVDAGHDSAVLSDSGHPTPQTDSGHSADTSVPDTSTPDSATEDTGAGDAAHDSGHDAGPQDAAHDSGPDAAHDAGPQDAANDG